MKARESSTRRPSGQPIRAVARARRSRDLLFPESCSPVDATAGFASLSPAAGDREPCVASTPSDFSLARSSCLPSSCLFALACLHLCIRCIVLIRATVMSSCVPSSCPTQVDVVGVNTDLSKCSHVVEMLASSTNSIPHLFLWLERTSLPGLW